MSVADFTSSSLKGELELLLVKRQVITMHELELSVNYARFTGLSVGEAIVALELADELEVVRAMGEVVDELTEVKEVFNLSDDDLSVIQSARLQLSSPASINRQQIVVGIKGSVLTVATSNILDVQALDSTRSFFAREGYQVQYVGTTHLEISLLQERVYQTGSDLREQIYQYFDDIERLTSRIHETLSLIIEMAVLEQASDIFFSLSKTDDVSFIYFKVNNLKRFRIAVPRICMESMHRAIKVDAGMDSGRKFGHQDGSMTCRVIKQRYRINLRVSAITTIAGEQITMRIQALRRRKATLLDLGFSEDDSKTILNVIDKKQGMVVLSGATGSGKTTTLYTLLDHFNVDEYNIITMEDPVEIRRRGINQIQINDAAGQTFRNSIRACLRQAPDVILIGEVRDQETAERAVEAANTGHMVFCTIHANSVAGVPARLQELGVERIQSFVENMALAIHQSLEPVQHKDKVRLSYELGGYSMGTKND